MRNGLSAGPLKPGLLYGEPIQAAALKPPTFSPELLYAIAWRETIRGQVQGLWPSALTVVASDNGCGLCQVTPAEWWPEWLHADWAEVDWRDPEQNAAFAVEQFLEPAETFWVTDQGMQGLDLARCIAAEYNCGRSQALFGHQQGNVDRYTTGGNYAADVCLNYTRLVNGQRPL